MRESRTYRGLIPRALQEALLAVQDMINIINLNIEFFQRIKKTLTTTSIAPGAHVQLYFDGGRSAHLILLETAQDLRVRVYATATGQTADLARSFGVAPPPDRLVLLDREMTAATNSLKIAPQTVVSNLESPPNIRIYVTLTNLGGASVPLSLDVTFASIEP